MKFIFWSLLLALFISRIYLLQPTQRLIGDGIINGGDNYEYFGFQTLVRDNLSHFKLPFSPTTVYRYPVGFNLGFGFDGALAVFSGALLGFIMNPILAYNLTIVFILWLNFIFTYLLSKKLSGSAYIAVLAGFIFGFSPYVFARLNAHLNLAFIGGFPLFFYAVVRIFEEIKKTQSANFKSFLLLWLGILMTAFGSLQYLILLSETIIIAVVFFIIFNRNNIAKIYYQIIKLIQKNKTAFVLSFILFITVFGAVYYQYLDAFFLKHLNLIDKITNYSKCCQPAFSDIFIPNRYLGSIWKSFNSSPSSIERVVTLGVIEWLIFFWLFLKSDVNRKLILITSGILFIFLATGLIGLPFIPEGGRIIVVFELLFIILLSRDFVKLKKEVFILLLLLLISERFTYGLYTSPMLPQRISQFVKKLPGKAVLDIPVSKYESFYSSLPYFYQKSIVSGYFHYTADTPESNLFLANPLISHFICGKEQIKLDEIKLIKLLRDNNIRTIVIHKDPSYSKYLYAECQNVRARIARLMPITSVLSTSTHGIKTANYQIAFHPSFYSQLYFERNGKLLLDGIFLSPSSMNNSYLVLPDYTVVNLDWQPIQNGIHVTFRPQLEIEGQAGQSVTLTSSSSINDNIYLTYFYAFDQEGNKTVKPNLEKVYSDEHYEIYAVN